MPYVQAGSTYYLINVQAGTCLDLSGHDKVSIIGHGYHNQINQKWIFQSAGLHKTYYIKSAGGNQYLSAAGDPYQGQKIVASSAPYAWRVEDEPRADGEVRIFCPINVNHCIDLDRGNSASGTPIQLWGRYEGKNQVWKIHKV